MSSTPTNQPSAGPTVKLHPAPDASSSEESQYMRLDLDKTTVEALKKAGQAGANVEISFGKSPVCTLKHVLEMIVSNSYLGPKYRSTAYATESNPYGDYKPYL